MGSGISGGGITKGKNWLNKHVKEHKLWWQMSSKICTMDAQGHICKYELEVSSSTPLGLWLEMLVNRLLPTGHQVVGDGRAAGNRSHEACFCSASVYFQVIQTDFCLCSCLSQDGQQPGQ